MISLYEWFKDVKGRTWCVVRVWTDGITTTVDLLEVGKPGPVNQPEKVILDLIASGTFKRF